MLTPTYGLTSTLSFYLPGQPDTYCLSWNYGMTPQPVNQHDLWHPNPRHDPDAFKNRPVIVVEDGNMPPNYAKLLVKKGVFGRLESLDRIFVRERHHHRVVGYLDLPRLPGPERVPAEPRTALTWSVPHRFCGPVTGVGGGGGCDAAGSD